MTKKKAALQILLAALLGVAIQAGSDLMPIIPDKYKPLAATGIAVAAAYAKRSPREEDAK